MTTDHSLDQQDLLYPQLANQLKEIGALISPSELHGHLCGRHVVGHHIEGVFGMRIIADYVDLSLSDLEPAAEQLNTLVENWVLLMDQDLFNFRLLLPEDDHALMSRLDELAHWAEGFLSGLGSTVGDEETQIMKDEHQALADLVEISRLDADVEDNDENEALYAEVSEYIRLAVFNFFDRFRELAEKIAQDELESEQTN